MAGFLQYQIVYAHKCADQYSAEDLRSLEDFIWVALTSLDSVLQTRASLESPDQRVCLYN